MPSLPQELLDSIVGEVEESAALKACATAGPRLCAASQRILLSRLTLRRTASSSYNYTAIRELLEQSPHIARYITRLRFLVTPLASPPSAVDIESLQNVLEKLGHVHRISLEGDRGEWESLPPRIASLLLKTVSRKNLHELHISLIHSIPLAEFSQLVGAAPLMSLRNVSVSLGSPLTQPLALETLVLDRGCDLLCRLLASRELASYTAGLRIRTLRLRSDYSHASAIIAASSTTLVHIRLECYMDTHPSALALPRLPRLQSLEILPAFDPAHVRLLPETLAPLLAPAAAPALSAITATCVPAYHTGPVALDAHSRALLSRLDGVLMAHPAPPRLRWGASARLAGPADFPALAEDVLGAMPRASATGRLSDFPRSRGKDRRTELPLHFGTLNGVDRVRRLPPVATPTLPSKAVVRTSVEPCSHRWHAAMPPWRLSSGSPLQRVEPAQLKTRGCAPNIAWSPRRPHRRRSHRQDGATSPRPRKIPAMKEE
ncbi:hypothetical protein B0H15DRAFT_957809 [Mycena belliarum]|uniref:Uncharacterized protein n=1 Tax=Mycena belliarum TaxID=1033014 RepID=A0AAD6XL70_9AGAR|nr:hypothetical protein B0H15DRAFT_957809 [Mycena belliae]